MIGGTTNGLYADFVRQFLNLVNIDSSIAIYDGVVMAITISDHYFSWIGECDATKFITVPLDAYREEAFVVCALPILHALIQLSHGGMLKKYEVTFVFI